MLELEIPETCDSHVPPRGFDPLMFSGYETCGVLLRPRGIRTYETMAAHKEALEADLEKRWVNRGLSEVRKSSWCSSLEALRSSCEESKTSDI